MREIIIKSPFEDVYRELFRHMVAAENPDLLFFIQIIEEIAAKKDSIRLDLAYQSLSDVITIHPAIFDGVDKTFFSSNPDSQYPAVSPQIALKVFMTLLAEPGDSIAAAHFLQSLLPTKSDDTQNDYHYLSPEDIGKIHNDLKAYIVSRHPNDTQRVKIDQLAALLYNLIVRDKALEDTDEVFSEGPFRNLSVGAFLEDTRESVFIPNIAAQQPSFETSPLSRNMNQWSNHIFTRICTRWRRQHPRIR